MANATDKTVTVVINPNATNLQSDVIAGATPTKAGCMTAAQAQMLKDGASKQTKTITWDNTQPLDGGFPYQDVTWDTAFASADDYAVFISRQLTAPVDVWEKLGARTASGTRILASDQFTGTTEIKGEKK